jgi:hypothetical protein
LTKSWRERSIAIAVEKGSFQTATTTAAPRPAANPQAAKPNQRSRQTIAITGRGLVVRPVV